MTGDRRDDTAAEARSLVLRAMGDAAGLTVKGQLRQAARHLGYAGDAWRLREALYRRAGNWCSAALDDLRRRFAAWREREAPQADPSALAGRVAAVRRLLAELGREVEALEAEVGGPLSVGEANEGGGAVPRA